MYRHVDVLFIMIINVLLRFFCFVLIIFMNKLRFTFSLDNKHEGSVLFSVAENIRVSKTVRRVVL